MASEQPRPGYAPGLPAAAAGTAPLGGDLVVNRLGYGAMRLPGPGVWGEPADPDNARAVLRRAVALGVTLIDTAGYDGPSVADRLIAEALHPYPPDLVIATKVGARRGADRSWHPDAEPENLRAAVEDDLRRLRLERLDLVHFHQTEGSTVPLAESVGALAVLRDEGKIRHVGVSNVDAAQLAEARRIVPVASVQNLYNLSDRHAQDLLDICTRDGIVFMPYFPLAIGALGQGDGPLADLAQRYHVAPAQVALAWLLACSPMMVPIPGTSSMAHLEENTAAAALRLADEDMAALAGL